MIVVDLDERQRHRDPFLGHPDILNHCARLGRLCADTDKALPALDGTMNIAMSSLSPRLQVRVQQKQILTPGLVQMVSLLQLNRLELKDMIQAEIAQNPVLEEAGEGGEELTPEELQPLLEAERAGDPADQSILEMTPGKQEIESAGAGDEPEPEPAAVGAPEAEPIAAGAAGAEPADTPEAAQAKDAADPFDEIDFDDYFHDYLDPGFKSPAAENIEK
ncbi:MAG TPA: hypothetical protein VFV14_02130, partial [Myxococcaceae bacterium]|nr:hypothetical protein [Myxococcaceae bacterium]